MAALVAALIVALIVAASLCGRPDGAYGYPPSSGKALGSLHVEELTTNGPHHFGLAGLEMDGSPLAAHLSRALPHRRARRHAPRRAHGTRAACQRVPQRDPAEL
jgi:hypothetical protein